MLNIFLILLIFVSDGSKMSSHMHALEPVPLPKLHFFQMQGPEHFHQAHSGYGWPIARMKLL
jgi:hypothetical protein